MKRLLLGFRHPSFPILVMVGFTFLLVAALLTRVYLADRDLALSRLNQIQASLNAETGVHFALQRIQQALVKSEALLGGRGVQLTELERFLPMDKWIRTGGRALGYFRLLEIAKVPGLDLQETPLFDESGLFRVVAEGRVGPYLFRSTGIIGIEQILTRFAVVNSLNTFFYGTPIQALVRESGSLEAFLRANEAFVDRGAVTSRGLINDPGLLHQVFRPDGESPFRTGIPGQKAPSTYGASFNHGPESPCYGPLFCQTSVIMDSDTFWGPVQTGSFFYRRGSGKPRIQTDHSLVAIPSSRRLQLAADSLEGDLPKGICLDRDSRPDCLFLPVWTPDLPALRQMARAQGIYIDAQGKGTNRGEPLDADFHFGTHHLFSESYLGPTSIEYERDEREEGFVVLSTETRFEGRNNLGPKVLRGARLLFSENTVYLRGDIGGDLVIVTPKAIFLTGSTNVDLPFNLFLVAVEGIALSTTDLEEFIATRNPGPDVIEAARHWIVNACLYKPGAGWYGSWSTRAGPEGRVIPTGLSCPLSVTITGGCLQGNLLRWLEFAGPGGVKVKWNPEGVSRLPVQPSVANLVRMKTVPTR